MEWMLGFHKFQVMTYEVGDQFLYLLYFLLRQKCLLPIYEAVPTPGLYWSEKIITPLLGVKPGRLSWQTSALSLWRFFLGVENWFILKFDCADWGHSYTDKSALASHHSSVCSDLPLWRTLFQTTMVTVSASVVLTTSPTELRLVNLTAAPYAQTSKVWDGSLTFAHACASQLYTLTVKNLSVKKATWKRSYWPPSIFMA